VAAISITRVYDALLTTTLQKYSKKLRDNFFEGVPFLDWLRKSGQKQTVDGGTHIVEHLLYEANSTARSFSGYATIDLTPQDGMTIAQFTPREYDVSVIISRREMQQNAGEARMINLLQAKTKQAESSLKRLFNVDAFGAQAGNSLDGLQTLVSDASNTCGSILESANTWWAPQRDTTAVTAANFKDNLLNIFNDCQRGGLGAPNFVITSQVVWELYHKLIEDQGEFRLAADNPAAGFGIKAISFMGVPFVWDLDCAATRLYLLNSDTLKLQVYAGADFDIGEMRQPIDQHAFAKSVYWMGNLTVNQRRANGIMTNVS
jgi:hypothetical protein